MSKKVLIVALAAVGLSSAAFADNVSNANQDVYVGVQAGYGDTNWSQTDATTSFANANTLGLGTLKLSSKDNGFAGGVLAGYDFNQYVALETGFVYFPKTTAKATVYDSNGNLVAQTSDSFNTYGIDALAKISVPLVDNFGLYAKAGPGYLRATGDGNVHNVDLVYGMGADYAITPNIVADASFTRFNGNYSLDSSKYQPNADLYALGLSYKFNV